MIKVVLTGLQANEQSIVRLAFLEIKELEISELSNYAKEFIINVQNCKIFNIKNSILNKMYFVNCDFSGAEKITIEDSLVSTAEFVNVDWGEITEERICSELFENEPKKAQDVYRQLKFAHDNRKDFIHGNDFYTLEMRAYEKYLTKVLKEKKRENTIYLLKDWIVFKISEISSNFSKDWDRALYWILFLGLFLSFCNIKFNNNFNSLFVNSFKLILIMFVFIQQFFSINFKNNNNYDLKTLKGVFIFSLFYYFLLKHHALIIPLLIIVFIDFLNFPLLILTITLFSIFICPLLPNEIYGNSFWGNLFKGLDFYFTSLAQAYMPWKTILADGSQKMPLYKTFYLLGSVAIYYLNYQLIISLRRKIKR